jgi:thiamine kinase-like enzyme
MQSTPEKLHVTSRAAMTPEEEIEARAALKAIPATAHYTGPIKRLGGTTNRVYHAGAFVLRLPGKGTSEIINRTHETEMATLTAKAHVSPGVIFADSHSGIMVTQHVTDAVTMTPQNFRTRKGSPARAGKILRTLHHSGAVFPFRFELFAMIDQYLAVLATKDVELPEGYHDVVAEAQSIRKALEANPVPLAPCHCDPLCENFLDTGERMWIVDWEYSGMNDPMWDLGDLSVEGSFTQEMDNELMHAYFGAAPSTSDHARMVIYKAMCDLLWTIWGLIQLSNNNPAEDFQSYATNRFNRCKALMATAEFKKHLANV